MMIDEVVDEQQQQWRLEDRKLDPKKVARDSRLFHKYQESREIFSVFEEFKEISERAKRFR